MVTVLRTASGDVLRHGPSTNVLLASEECIAQCCGEPPPPPTTCEELMDVCLENYTITITDIVVNFDCTEFPCEGICTLTIPSLALVVTESSFVPLDCQWDVVFEAEGTEVLGSRECDCCFGDPPHIVYNGYAAIIPTGLPPDDPAYGYRVEVAFTILFNGTAVSGIFSILSEFVTRICPDGSYPLDVFNTAGAISGSVGSIIVS